MRFARIPCGRFVAVLFWSRSWFDYARSRNHFRWLFLYRMSYGGFTLRFGKLTFALVPR